MSDVSKDPQTKARLLAENEELRRRLEEAEQTLEAIHTGDVDALVVSNSQGEHIYTLTGAEHVYRVIVETMNEAAVTVDTDGRILFCNQRFCDLMKTPMQETLGLRITTFVARPQRQPLETLMADAQAGPVQRRITLRAADDTAAPVQFSASLLHTNGSPSLCLVASDLTELEASANSIRVLREHQQALEESESRFRTIFEASQDAMVITDDEGTYIQANPAVETVFGLSPEQLIGQSLSDFMSGLIDFSTLWQDFLATGSFRGEIPLIGADGQVRYIDVYAVASILPGRHLCVIRDITERKRVQETLQTANEQLQVQMEELQAQTEELNVQTEELRVANQELQQTEQALRESRRRLDIIVDSIVDGFYALDHHWRFTHINDAALAYFHKTREQVLGHTLVEVFPGVRGTVFETEFRRAMETGQPVHIEAPSVFFDRTVEIHAYPGPENLTVLFRDVTERLRMQQVLRESEKRLAADLDAMTRLHKVGALFVQEGNLVRVLGEIIDAAIAVSGADFGHIQLLDRKSSTLKIVAHRGFPPWWVDFWNTVCEGQGACGTALARGERVIIEDVEQSPIFAGTPRLEIQLRAGVRAVQSTPLLSRSGRPLGMLSTHYRAPQRPDERSLRLLDLLARQTGDIIERAQIEDTLREWNKTLEARVGERTAELEFRARQLQKLALELSQTEDRERKRLAEILHDDLQQQLAAVKFHLGIMAGRARGDAAVQNSAAQLDGMLRDAIETSRSLSHELSPAVMYHGDMGEILEWLANQIRLKHGMVVRVTSCGPIDVDSDALKVFLFKAVQEMLFNAVKHARVGEATVRMRRRGRYVSLCVSDRGRGFDPRELKQAAGFGLMSIRERIGLLGGRMRIHSVRGVGSRLIITVPDGQGVDEPVGATLRGRPLENRTADESPALEEGRHGGLPLRVLIADDHEIVRHGLVSLLAEARDIELVGQAGNGREAVDLAYQLRPDVVIMDVAMPLMNGDEAARQILRHLPQTRIVALSMYDEAGAVERMHRAGAESYVLKTAPSNELLAAVRGNK